MIEVKDFGVEQLKRDMEALNDTVITVGWQGDEGAQPHPESPKITMAQLAAFHEYGTRKMPARPSIGTMLATRSEDIRRVRQRLMGALVDGRVGAAQVIEGMGEALVEALIDTIDSASSWAAPLSPRTKPPPLVDTGAFRAAVSWAERASGKIVRSGK